MKSISIALCFLTTVSIAQPNQEPWAQHAGGLWMDHGKAVAVDPKGNVYVTGGFQSQATFGTKTITSNGFTDIFVARYSPAGDLSWIVQAGSDTLADFSLAEYGNDLQVAGDFLYVTGVCKQKAHFGGNVLLAYGSDDIFLAKYTLDGEFVWAKTMGGPGQDIPNSMAIDETGNIYLTGSFQKTAMFGQISVTAQNAPGMFLAKFDGNGNASWLRQSVGGYSAQGKSVKFNNGFCYVAGEFENQIAFSGRQIETPGKGIFLAKYNASGDVSSVSQLNGGDEITTEDMTVDDGKVYLVGSFLKSMSSSGFQATSTGNLDAYFAAFDTNLTISLLENFGGPSVDIPADISLLSDKTLLISGGFQESLQARGLNFKSKGGEDIFMINFAKDGRLIAGETYGGVEQDRLNDVVVNNNTIFLTGFFRKATQFADSTISSRGSSDIMIATMKAPSTGRKDVIAPTIYPNPCKEFFNIGPGSDGIVKTVRIFNIIGALLMEKNSDDLSKDKIFVDGLIPGLYVLQLFDGKAYFESKLIVSR